MTLNIIFRFFNQFQHDFQKCETDCIDFYFRYLTYLGLLPRTRGEEIRRTNVRYWIPRFVFWAELFKSFVMSPMSVYMFSDQSIMKIIDPLAAMFISVFMAVYCGSFIFQQNRFEEVKVALKEMEEFVFLHKESPRWVAEETKWFLKLTFSYYVSAVCILVPLLILGCPLYAYDAKELMLSYWYPFEFYKSPNFELITFTITGLAAYGVIVMSIANCLLIALLVKAEGHLQLLNHNLKDIFRKETETTNDINSDKNPTELSVEEKTSSSVIFNNSNWKINESPVDEKGFTSCDNEELAGSESVAIFAPRDDSEIEKRLNICIRHHQSVHRFTEKVSQAFQIILLQQFFSCVVPVILGFIMLSHAKEFDPKMCLAVLLVGFCWADQALFSWFADKMSYQSGLVREAVFGCDWLRASNGFKRSMRIIISRSNQPMVIKVAGFIPLNMKTFHEIVKLTYTYYMSLTTTLNSRRKNTHPSH